jgi:hypothetical protein
VVGRAMMDKGSAFLGSSQVLSSDMPEPSTQSAHEPQILTIV